MNDSVIDRLRSSPRTARCCPRGGGGTAGRTPCNPGPGSQARGPGPRRTSGRRRRRHRWGSTRRPGRRRTRCCPASAPSRPAPGRGSIGSAAEGGPGAVQGVAALEDVGVVAAGPLHDGGQHPLLGGAEPIEVDDGRGVERAPGVTGGGCRCGRGRRCRWSVRTARVRTAGRAGSPPGSRRPRRRLVARRRGPRAGRRRSTRVRDPAAVARHPDRARDAEVAEAGLVEAIEEHVVGLDVAVQDPGSVRRLKSPRKLQPDVEDARGAAAHRCAPGCRGTLLGGRACVRPISLYPQDARDQVQCMSPPRDTFTSLKSQLTGMGDSFRARPASPTCRRWSGRSPRSRRRLRSSAEWSIL